MFKTRRDRKQAKKETGEIASVANQTNESNEVIMTKGEFCLGLGNASSWEETQKYTESKINELVKWIEELDGVYKYSIRSNFYTLSQTTLSQRAMFCYRGAINYMVDGKFGDALHEIHDFIYGYGNDLGKQISEVEFLLLYQWTLLFKKITVKDTQTQ